MAHGIHETSFDAVGFQAEVQRLQRVGRLPSALRCEIDRPFPNDPAVHWLLRSLTMVRLHTL